MSTTAIRCCSDASARRQPPPDRKSAGRARPTAKAERFGKRIRKKHSLEPELPSASEAGSLSAGGRESALANSPNKEQSAGSRISQLRVFQHKPARPLLRVRSCLAKPRKNATRVVLGIVVGRCRPTVHRSYAVFCGRCRTSSRSSQTRSSRPLLPREGPSPARRTASAARSCSSPYGA